MLRKIKLYTAKKALNVFLERNRPRLVGKREKIGIILDLDMMEEGFDCTDLRKEMDFSYNTCSFIVCSKQKFISEKYSLNQFDRNNLGWNGMLKEGSKEKLFQETSYDLLLNYFVNPSMEILIFSASIEANLKVGFPLSEKRLNDLEINVEPLEYEIFSRELKKYLASMKMG